MGSTVSTEEEWVTEAMGQLSPRFSEFGESMLKGEVEPVVKNSLHKNNKDPKGNSLSSLDFQFTKTDFGTIPPKISNMKTHKVDPEDMDGGTTRSIVIDFDVEYLGDCDIHVSLMGIGSGVRDIQLSGRARLTLKPTTGKCLPFIGGMQLCFLDQPDFNFDLEGLADICDWSFLRRKIRKSLDEDIAKRIVYPNKILIPMTGSAMDPMAVKAFEPMGALGVRMLRGSGLPKKSGLRTLIGQHKPDAYAKIRVGATMYETEVVKNTTDPEWDGKWYDFLLERRQGHKLRIDMFDEDSFSKDDYLGKVLVNIEDYVGNDSGEGDEGITMVLEDDPLQNSSNDPTPISGDISFELRWRPFLTSPDSFENGPNIVLLTVFLYSCNNLMEFADGSKIEENEGIPEENQVVIQITGQPKKSQIVKNTQHPNYEEGFTFILSDNWAECTAEVSIVENSSGGLFGTFLMPLSSLVEQQIRRKCLPIVEEKPVQTITVSANLRFA